jgi:hypothetical protein
MNRLLPFVFILVAVGIFFGYVQPTWSGEIAQRKAEIASYDSALEAAARFADKEAELERLRNEIPQEQLARLNTFLPDSVDNVQLILDLNSLADRAGLKLSDFTTASAVNESSSATASDSGDGSLGTRNQLVDSLTLSVTAEGSYDAFRSFIAGAEQSLRPLDITEITLENSDTGVYKYEMTLKFYWLR